MELDLKIGLVGYGEVGKILCRALREKGLAWVGAWDVLFLDAVHGPAMKARARDDRVEACESLAALLARSDIVISAVTAANALEVAVEAAPSARAGAFFLDLNSASPMTKAKAAKLIDSAGAYYVEAAVMTPVPPYGIRAPMLLGGERAAELAEKLKPLGFDMTVVSEKIGVASAIKLCRSVFIKGLEAIVVESYTLARRHGVEQQLLASLARTFPEIDWEKQGSYLFSRVAEHGRRRAEEMREAANTVREAGLDPWMSAAAAETQGSIARLSKSGLFRDLTEQSGWREYADQIIAAVESRGTTIRRRFEGAPAGLRRKPSRLR
jgi:3-hydroxyisobutyrate dehydrogenase-like beta-hydroxyacid dehydrogenase